ncbi:MAG: CopD family protein [Pseudomonadota bacterium]
MLYLIVKALHIVFVIAWMAALLVYPRYRIHQLSSRPGEPLFETMREASARLLRIIMRHSMHAVWLLGLWLVYLNPGWLSSGWVYAKLLLVIAMTGMHWYFVRIGRQIDALTADGERDDASDAIDPRRLRMLNEVPFLLLIAIVLLVVIKPF